MSSRHLLRLFLDDDDLFSPPPPPPPPFFPSTCPLFDSFHSLDLDLDLDLDLVLPAPCPYPYPYLLDSLGDRVAALELALASASVAARAPPPPRRKYTYVAESGGRKVKWTAEEKGRGERTVKWEAEVKSPCDDGFDRKWKWEAKGLGGAGGGRKVKWGKEVKGKRWLEPWSHAYTVEEAFRVADDDDEEEVEVEEVREEKKKKKKVKEEKEKKKCPVKIVEIEDNTAGCVAIRKAFARSHGRGKRKEPSPQDAALLIQMAYRAHLARRSQVLRCLRDLAVAKAKLKEIRTLFYNISYRRRIVHDHEGRQRFIEKIIVLLLTVDALEGPDYMVRTAKKSMLEELEGMMEIVDPQPTGKRRTLSRRKFDLPEGGAIRNEIMAGVNNAVRIIEEGK